MTIGYSLQFVNAVHWRFAVACPRLAAAGRVTAGGRLLWSRGSRVRKREPRRRPTKPPTCDGNAERGEQPGAPADVNGAAVPQHVKRSVAAAFAFCGAVVLADGARGVGGERRGGHGRRPSRQEGQPADNQASRSVRRQRSSEPTRSGRGIRPASASRRTCWGEQSSSAATARTSSNAAARVTAGAGAGLSRVEVMVKSPREGARR